MSDVAVVMTVVFAVNLLPAFGPPTWAVLVFLRLNLGLAAVPLVICGAVAAAAGRLTLALAARALRTRLPAKRVAGLDALREELSRRRGAAFGGLALFALSPLPSAQLFIAAGITGVRLLPLTLAFFTGRLVSYALYVGAATAAERSLGPLLADSLRSPASIALQVAMLAGLVALVRFDWVGFLARRAGRSSS